MGFGRVADRRADRQGMDPYAAALEERTQDFANMYQDRRLPMQQAILSGHNQTMGQLQPMNAAIGRMYGDQAQMQLGSAFSPIAPNMGALQGPGGLETPQGLTSVGTPDQFSPLPEPKSPKTQRKERRGRRKKRREDRRERRKKRRQN